MAINFNPQELDRPEYPIFEKMLGRPIVRATTPEGVHRQIKELLIETYEKKPEDLVKVAAAAQMKSLWNSMGNRAADIEESFSYVVNHLHERRDSGISAKAKTARGSSTRIINYYDPARGGMISYLKQGIAWIITDYLTEKSRNGKTISLNALEEKGLTLANGRRFVKMGRDEGPAEGRDTDSTQHFSSTNRSRMLSGMDEDEGAHDGYAEAEVRTPDELEEHIRKDDEEYEHDEFADDAEERGKKSKTTKVSGASRNRRLELDGANRFDLAFFREELGLSAEESLLPSGRESRANALRELGGKVIAQNENCPDRESLAESLQDWDPNKDDFFNFFPEFQDYLKTRDSVVAPAELEFEESIVELASSSTEMEMITASIDQSEFISKKLAVEIRAYRGNIDVNSPDREDYAFLRDRLGIQEGPKQDSKERTKDIRKLASKFVGQICANAPDLQEEFEADLQNWNPSTQSFTRALSKSILRIEEEGKLNPDVVQAITLSTMSAWMEKAPPIAAPTKENAGPYIDPNQTLLIDEGEIPIDLTKGKEAVAKEKRSIKKANKLKESTAKNTESAPVKNEETMFGFLSGNEAADQNKPEIN